MEHLELRLPSDLRVYYKNIFPIDLLVKWMKYGKEYTEYFSRREFAFILEDNLHLRYRSFSNQKDFHEDLIRTNPEKIDLGAVYNYSPARFKNCYDFVAEEREVVFDIDLSDYDPIRTCCKNATVCPKCWKFMVIGARILDGEFDYGFAFSSRLWVFSGRRGVHLWIADKIIRAFTDYQRESIAMCMNFFKPNGDCEVTRERDTVVRCTVQIRNAYRIALKDGLFEEMIYEQGWLDNDDFVTDYRYMSDFLKYKLGNFAKTYKTPKERWHLLRALFDDDYRNALPDEDDLKYEQPQQNRDRYYLIHFVLKRCYPRIDMNVTSHTNHLLKAPFSVHPKTGNIAVPLDVETMHEFDVINCPRIDRVVDEWKELQKEAEVQNNPKLASERGILAPYIANYKKFVDTIKP